MRCKSCDRKLPPHRIMSGHKDKSGKDTEEDLCNRCLGIVYLDTSDFHDMYQKDYVYQEHETPLTQLLPDVNN